MKTVPKVILCLAVCCTPLTSVAATLLGDTIDVAGRFRYSIPGVSLGPPGTVDWHSNNGLVIYDTANQSDPSILEEFDRYFGYVSASSIPCSALLEPLPPESGCIVPLRAVFDVYESDSGWEFLWSYENIATDETTVWAMPRIMDVQDLDWVDIVGGGEITGVEIIQQDFSTTSPVVTAHGVSLTSSANHLLAPGERIENRYRFITPYASVVPVPGAAWLFGSALWLLAWMRRKAA